MTYRVLTATGSSTNIAYASRHFTMNDAAIPIARIEGHLLVGTFSTEPTAVPGKINAANDVVAYSTSDERLKHRIEPLENPLAAVDLLRGVRFDWRQEFLHVHGYDQRDVGLIAQEVAMVLPESVRTNENGYMSVRYEKIVPLLVEAVKELKRQLSELRDEVASIKENKKGSD